MKKLLVGLLLVSVSSFLFAKNAIMTFPLADVLNSKEAKEVLDPNIEIKFGSGNKGLIIKKQLQSNKKTNAVGKSDQKACNWALLSALKTFQQRAIQEGGTKVINITGFYYKKHFDSKTQFQCGVGNIVAGVTLKGDIAK